MDDFANYKAVIMRFVIFRLVLFLVFCSLLNQNLEASSKKKFYGKKLVVKEEAVFKIKNQVFFLSDLGPIIQEVRFFRCLSSDSLILQGVGLNKAVLLTIPKIESVQNLSKKQEDFLGKIIRVIKTSIYIKERQKEFGKYFDKLASFKRCQKKIYGRFVKGVAKKDLMLTESFLKDRFDPKSQVVDVSQYEIFKKKNKFLNEKALKEAFKREKNLQIVESIKLFVASLDKRISHEAYF